MSALTYIRPLTVLLTLLGASICGAAPSDSSDATMLAIPVPGAKKQKTSLTTHLTRFLRMFKKKGKSSPITPELAQKVKATLIQKVGAKAKSWTVALQPSNRRNEWTVRCYNGRQHVGDWTVTRKWGRFSLNGGTPLSTWHGKNPAKRQLPFYRRQAPPSKRR